MATKQTKAEKEAAELHAFNVRAFGGDYASVVQNVDKTLITEAMSVRALADAARAKADKARDKADETGTTAAEDRADELEGEAEDAETEAEDAEELLKDATEAGEAATLDTVIEQTKEQESAVSVVVVMEQPDLERVNRIIENVREDLKALDKVEAENIKRENNTEAKRIKIGEMIMEVRAFYSGVSDRVKLTAIESHWKEQTKTSTTTLQRCVLAYKKSKNIPIATNKPRAPTPLPPPQEEPVIDATAEPQSTEDGASHNPSEDATVPVFVADHQTPNPADLPQGDGASEKLLKSLTDPWSQTVEPELQVAALTQILEALPPRVRSAVLDHFGWFSDEAGQEAA